VRFIWRNGCLGPLASMADSYDGTPAHVEDFSRGKRLKVFIGSGPAGSYNNFGAVASKALTSH